MKKKIKTAVQASILILLSVGSHAQSQQRVDSLNKAMLTAPTDSARVVLKAELQAAYTAMYEKKGMYKEAVAHFKAYMDLTDTLYADAAQRSIRDTEARYMPKQQQEEIQLLRARADNQQRTIYFLLALSALATILFFFLYRAHLFRHRFFSERQKVLEGQSAYALLKKEEAEYVLRLEVVEAGRLAAERKLHEVEKEQYQKELMSNVLHLEGKNKLLLKLKEAVLRFDRDELDVKQVQKVIDENLDLDEEQGPFDRNFEVVYPGFFSKLQEKSVENLTQLDLRYCAYIRMGLSTKEMSNLLNVDPASIRKARYRIKQKFNLGKDDELDDFIQTLLVERSGVV